MNWRCVFGFHDWMVEWRRGSLTGYALTAWRCVRCGKQTTQLRPDV